MSELEAVPQSLTFTRLLTTEDRGPAAGLKAAEAKDGPSAGKFNSETPEEAAGALTGLTGKIRRPASDLNGNPQGLYKRSFPKTGSCGKTENLPKLRS